MRMRHVRRPLQGGLSVLCLSLLAACGGSGDTGPQGATGATGATGRSALVRLVAEPSGANCPTGGRAVKAGQDANADGTLDDAEVSSVGFVCNGAAGAAGATGTAGAPGADGLSTLVAMTAEAAGSNCAHGGVRVTAGSDTNRDGSLGATEVSSSAFVCNGADGATGATGAAGLDTLLRASAEAAGANCATGGTRYQSGLDANRNGTLDAAEVSGTSYVCNGATGATGAVGAQGPAGPSGLSVLLASTAEAVGANCRYGGTRIDSGLDLNASGGLDAGEITATSYVCNGAGVTWASTAADAALAANSGTIATGASRVTLTLPAAPALGDQVQVTGGGSGGWKLAQNAGQQIVTSGVNASTPIGAGWSVRNAGVTCSAVASGNSGANLAVVAAGVMRVSGDSGASWIDTAPGADTFWNSQLAISSSGSTVLGWKSMTASPFSRTVQVSTDGGQTFTQAPGLSTTANWTAVAASGDGSTLIAATALFFDGQIHYSRDGGASWSAVGSQVGNWTAAAASANGSVMAVTHAYRTGTDLSSFILVSTDGGNSWTVRDSRGPNGRDWKAIAMSSDGQRMAAADRLGRLYLSADTGATWTAAESNRDWTGLQMSADGRRIVATAADNTVVVSGDGGMTWTARTPYPGVNLVTALSGNGSRLYGCHPSAGLVLSQPATVPSFTTPGTGGYLAGPQYSTVTLQFLGNGVWNVLAFVGSAFEAE